MEVENHRRWPQRGQILKHNRNGTIVTAKVVEVDSATKFLKIEFAGKSYMSLSAAAIAAGGYRTNGWVFWGLMSNIWKKSHAK